MKKDYRKELKKEIMKRAMDIDSYSDEEEYIKCELNLRLLKFLQYENDRDFVIMMEEFCAQKNFENKMKESKKNLKNDEGRE